MTGADADYWWKAMEEEITLLKKQGTWKLVDKPKDRKVVGCRWTYVIKYGPNGEILRYKACLVAQGYSQIPGLNFSDTYSFTVCLDSIRAILHLTTAHGWYRCQDDINGTFLHSTIDHEIYMHQPEGFSDGMDKVAKLLMGLYGIKQGAYLWNKHMHRKLTSSGFVRISADYAVYTRHSKKGTSITAIHVDNALMVTDTKAMLKQTWKLLHSLFEMKEEDPDWLMGIKLTDDRKNGTINLSQVQYINMLL